jgi:hypothetical protein
MANYRLRVGWIPQGVPLWRQGMAVGEVKAIPGSAFAIPGVDLDVIDAWGCLALIDGTGTLVSAANGGHGDTYDNGVYSISLLADTTAWVTRIASSSFASVVLDASYYTDGKPGSRHGYGYAHYIPQRGKVVLFGQRGTYSNGLDNYTVDAVDVNTWTWDGVVANSPGTSGSGYPNITAGHWGIARDSVTGNVYTQGNTRWNQASNTVETVSGYSTSTVYFPAAYDSTRQQFFCMGLGDGQGFGETFYARKWTASASASTTVTNITINSSSAYTQFLADSPEYAGMDYDPANGRFLFYDGRGSAAGRIYVITPNSGSAWDMSILTTAGDTLPATVSAGINGRFKYVPALGGFFVMPSATAGIYFLRTT